MRQNTFYLQLLFVLMLASGVLSCTDHKDDEKNGMLPSLIVSEYDNGRKPGYKVTEEYRYDYEVGGVLTVIHTSKTDEKAKIKNVTYATHIVNEEGKERIGFTITTYDNEKVGSEKKTLATSFKYTGTTIRVESDQSVEELMVNDKGQLLTYKEFLPKLATDSCTKCVLHTYVYDEAGNIIRTKTEDPETRELIEEFVFEYDNQNGIFKHVNLPQWFIVARLGGGLNLVTHVVKKSQVENGAENVLSTYNYQYDKKGYPVSYKVVPAKDYLGFVDKPINISYTSIKK